MTYYEQPYAYEFENLDEMDKFLEIHNLSRLNHEETKNLNTPKLAATSKHSYSMELSLRSLTARLVEEDAPNISISRSSEGERIQVLLQVVWSQHICSLKAKAQPCRRRNDAQCQKIKGQQKKKNEGTVKQRPNIISNILTHSHTSSSSSDKNVLRTLGQFSLHRKACSCAHSPPLPVGARETGSALHFFDQNASKPEEEPHCSFCCLVNRVHSQLLTTIRKILSISQHNRNSEETIVHKVFNRQGKFQKEMKYKDLPKKRSNEVPKPQSMDRYQSMAC
ncbi:uncharacterized protein LOC111745853 [Pteropus vampyrus]|uniref:Uncharacterized protein LOC111745853 n=1 Tax=Pteropus vampyrus TaxID=132908 RepID=A0A6P6CYU1_PTEVA|nr:uncharacterized protein LOC111745853 [Pteropus vampyrus]